MIAIVQARVGSIRLPQKVLKLVLGKEMLFHVVERATRAKSIDKLVVATTTLKGDDSIEELCLKYGWECFRHISASFNDLTGLYYATALKYKDADMMRLTGDNPLIDPNVIDDVVSVYNKNPDADYVGNCESPLTFPIGIAVEVFKLSALSDVWVNCKDMNLRQHATLPIRVDGKRFKIIPVYNTQDLSGHRFTVDTLEDFKFVNGIFEHFGNNRMSMEDIVKWLNTKSG